jgi:hypothetical protein
MTPAKFRRLASDLTGVTERQRMNHPDFRVERRIFATLGYPDKGWAMVKLTPEQQRSFVSRAPNAFRPCAGKWGERGATNVELNSAKPPIVRAALKAAWRNAVEQKRLAEPAPVPHKRIRLTLMARSPDRAIFQTL